MPRVTNEKIGKNVERARTRKKLSLEDVAQEMRTAGYKWTKTTAFNVEHAVRQLKITEMPDLAQVLGTTVDELMSPYEEDTFIYTAINHIEYDYREIIRLALKLKFDRIILRRIYDSLTTPTELDANSFDTQQQKDFLNTFKGLGGETYLNDVKTEALLNDIKTTLDGDLQTQRPDIYAAVFGELGPDIFDERAHK